MVVRRLPLKFRLSRKLDMHVAYARQARHIRVLVMCYLS